MIKSIHEILLSDVILLDATKSAKHLKKYWFIPLYFCRTQLESLAKEIFTAIGNETINDIEHDTDKLISYRNIQLLEALYKAVNIEFNLKPQINVWKLILEKQYKDSAQLEEVIKQAKTHTGIEIKTPQDLKDFEDFIQHKIDKHNEQYPIIEPTGNEVKLMKVIYSVFQFMKEPYNQNMPLIAYIEMKEEAEKRIHKQTIQDDGEK